MVRFFDKKFLMPVLLAVFLLPMSANAAVLQYTETFSSNPQPTTFWNTDGAYLISLPRDCSHYSLWNFAKLDTVPANNANIRMTETDAAADKMTLAVSPSYVAYAMLKAESILPTAQFYDLSAGDLVFEAEFSSNYRNAGVNTGGAHSGIRIDDLVFLYHPGYSPGGAFRIHNISGYGGVGGQILANQNMGFTPGSVDNGQTTLVKLTVSENTATGNYDFLFETGLKEAGNGYTYNYTYSAPMANYPNGLTEIGVYANNGINTQVDNVKLTAPFSDTAYDAVRVSDVGKAAWNAAIRADNPLHWYRFDAGPGDLVLKDYGSLPFDGMCTRLPALASHFDGTNRAYVMLDAPTLTENWSAEFIVMVDKEKKQSSFVGTQGSQNGALKAIQGGGAADQHPGFTKFGATDFRFTPAAGADLNYPTDEWVHIVYTRDLVEGTLIYLDGELLGTSASSIDLYLGALGASVNPATGGVGDIFKGMMDEAVFYDYVLTPEAVAGHYAAWQTFGSGNDVPEPATWAMMVLGVAGLWAVRRKIR